jgi:hypothetical protein
MKLLKQPCIYLLGACCLLISGCADLASIKKFSAISADSAGYTSLVSDYPKSAQRLQRYEDSNVRAQLDPVIQKRNSQEQPLLALHHGVQDYMNALGSLASDDLISYDTSLDSVSDGLKQTGALTANEADAFGALMKLLAKAATDAYRQHQLKSIIQEANPHFQRIVAGMTNLVLGAFVSSLDNEKNGVSTYFKTVVTAADKQPPQGAAIELVNEVWQQRLDDIATKRDACIAYAQTLDEIAKGHQALFDHANDLTSDQLLSTMNLYATAVSQAFAAVNKL